MQLDLNRMAVFAAVVEAGSFTGAAERLGVAKSRVSQQVSLLEADLGVRLMNRTTRRLVLTEAGERFYPRCQRVVAESQAAASELLLERDTPSGTLRLSAPFDFGTTAMPPVLAEYARRYPHVTVDARFSDQVLDMLEERLDLTIRVGWLTDSGLVARKLADFSQVVCASPAYLRRKGWPRTPAELAAHDWVRLTVLREPDRWRFTTADGRQEEVRVGGPLSVNSATAVKALLLEGAGVGVMPEFAARDELARGDLVTLVPEARLPQGGIYAVFPSRQQPASVRALVALLTQQFAAHPMT